MTLAPVRAEDADEDVRIFQVGRDVDLLDGDERALESDLARENAAELALESSLTRNTMFHENRSRRSTVERL